jgi:hypothetical protein
MPARMPGVTTDNTPCGQPASFEWAVRLQGLDRILRTSRIKAATWPQQWADKKLIAANQQDQGRGKKGFHRRSDTRKRTTRSDGLIVIWFVLSSGKDA